MLYGCDDGVCEEGNYEDEDDDDDSGDCTVSRGQPAAAIQAKKLSGVHE